VKASVSQRMKVGHQSPPVWAWVLALTPVICAAAPNTERHAGEGKPRVVITADPELDDNNTIIRAILYGAEVDLEGLVYAGSQFHWRGDGNGTTQYIPSKPPQQPPEIAALARVGINRFSLPIPEMRPQSQLLFTGELEHEVGREPCPVATYLFIEPLGRHSVNSRQRCVQDYPPVSACVSYARPPLAPGMRRNSSSCPNNSAIPSAAPVSAGFSRRSVRREHVCGYIAPAQAREYRTRRIAHSS